MKFTTFLVALASAGAVRVHKMDDSNSDSAAQATGFEGFGGFGGSRGLHQFNGFMSNAFGDLEGQFDSSGFNQDFSASQDRKFDTGYGGQHFLENIDHDSFGSDLGSSTNQQKQGHSTPAVYRGNKPASPGSVPRYHDPLPTTKHDLYSQRRPELGQTTTGKRPYPTIKHTTVLNPHKVQPYHFTQNRPSEQIVGGYGRVYPTYSGQRLNSAQPKSVQVSGTTKYPAKIVQHLPVAGQQAVSLRDVNPDEGFTFGAEKFY